MHCGVSGRRDEANIGLASLNLPPAQVRAGSVPSNKGCLLWLAGSLGEGEEGTGLSVQKPFLSSRVELTTLSILYLLRRSRPVKELAGLIPHPGHQEPLPQASAAPGLSLITSESVLVKWENCFSFLDYTDPLKQ